MDDPMREIPSPELPWYAAWRNWLGITVLAGIIALIAKPVCQFVVLIWFLSQMGNMNG